MDPLIETYIHRTFHPETVDSIAHSFRLMDAFELQDYEQDFVELLMVEDMDLAQNVQDRFTTLLHIKLDKIIHAHLLLLNDAATLYEKNAIAEGFLNIQELEDYSNIIIVLEAGYDPEEKLAQILSQCCTLQPLAIEILIERFDPATLDMLKTYIYNKEANDGKIMTSFTELQKKIIKNLRTLKAFTAGKSCLGLMLMNAGMLIGQPLERYMPFVDDSMRNNDYDQLALDVFSLILLTDEGFNNPVITFRKRSGLLLDNIMQISRVDALVAQLSAAFETYKSNLQITEAKV